MDVAVNNTLNFAESFFIFELGFVPIEMAINGFAFLIVVKHTPERMKEYRKYLITVQFWMSNFDLCSHLLVRPFFFFPYVALGCTGILSRFFSVSASIQSSLIIISLMANICGLMSTLMYRRNQMLPPGSRMKLSEGQMRIVHCGGILGNIINCAFFVIAGQDNAGPVNSTDPRLEYIQTVEYFLTPLTKIWFIIAFIVFAWIIAFSITFVFSIFCQLSQMKAILSERTFEMQKSFSMTLLLQLGATFFLFLLPMGFSFIAIFIHIDVNILEQLLSYLPCFHSTVYTLILLIYTPVYFDATLCYLRLRKDSRMRRPTLIEPSHSDSQAKTPRPKPVKTQSLTSNIVH